MAKQTNSGLGWFGMILTIIFLWALVMGVTVGNRHYELNCSGNGVEIESTVSH